MGRLISGIVRQALNHVIEHGPFLDLPELLVAETEITALAPVNEHADMCVTALDLIIPAHPWCRAGVGGWRGHGQIPGFRSAISMAS